MQPSPTNGAIDLEPRLDKTRQVRYWSRCIKTLLPRPYTSNDSNRMYLAFMMLCALDVLGSLTTVCNADERKGFINWIYHCQHPDGGFRMWPGTDLGERKTELNAKWDPAHIPATYFALASLLILGDDFQRVERKRTLQWLTKLQRPDGSFGETLVDGVIEGGQDPRFGFCATGIRYILRGLRTGSAVIEQEAVPDIDVDQLVRCVRLAESYDGGIADQPLHEPHAGYTYCSLGALSFIGRLNRGQFRSDDVKYGPSHPQDVVRWLVYRQTDLLNPDAALDTEFTSSTNAIKVGPPAAAAPRECATSNAASVEPPVSPLHQSPSSTILYPPLDKFDSTCIGLNGRTNKVADTCYAWWAGASLYMLGHPSLYDHKAVRRYLLEKTQHPVLGGFGKYPNELPDIYHSCLGLAALSLAGGCGEDLKEFDAGMCLSKEAKGRLPALWASWDGDGGDVEENDRSS